MGILYNWYIYQVGSLNSNRGDVETSRDESLSKCLTQIRDNVGVTESALRKRGNEWDDAKVGRRRETCNFRL